MVPACRVRPYSAIGDTISTFPSLVVVPAATPIADDAPAIADDDPAIAGDAPASKASPRDPPSRLSSIPRPAFDENRPYSSSDLISESGIGATIGAPGRIRPVKQPKSRDGRPPPVGSRLRSPRSAAARSTSRTPSTSCSATRHRPARPVAHSRRFGLGCRRSDTRTPRLGHCPHPPSENRPLVGCVPHPRPTRFFSFSRRSGD